MIYSHENSPIKHPHTEVVTSKERLTKIETKISWIHLSLTVLVNNCNVFDNNLIYSVPEPRQLGCATL